MKRRFTAMLLALALVCSLLPGTAWAAGPAPAPVWTKDATNERTVEKDGITYTLGVDSDNGKPAWQVTACDKNFKFDNNIAQILDVIEDYSVISIRSQAFEKNKNISIILISDRLKEIQDSAFEACEGLTSVVVMNRGVSNLIIRENAFNGCEDLDKFIGSVKEVESYAFIRCNLKSFFVPHGPEKIGKSALAGNPLTHVYIQGNFDGANTKDSTMAFGGNADLKVIHVEGGMTPAAVEILCGKNSGVVVHDTVTRGITMPLPNCVDDGYIVGTIMCGDPIITTTTTTKPDGTTETTTTESPCPFNGWEMEKVILPAYGHDWKTESVDIGDMKDQPLTSVDSPKDTCKVIDVVYHDKCTRCDATQNRSEKIVGTKAHDYEFGSLEDILESTCTQYGVKMGAQKCKVCDVERYSKEELKALAEKYRDYLDISDQLLTIEEDIKKIDVKITEIESDLVTAEQSRKDADDAVEKIEEQIKEIDKKIAELENPTTPDSTPTPPNLDDLVAQRNELLEDQQIERNKRTAAENAKKELETEKKELEAQKAKLEDEEYREKLEEQQKKGLDSLKEAGYTKEDTTDPNKPIIEPDDTKIGKNSKLDHKWSYELSSKQEDGFNCEKVEDTTKVNVVRKCTVCGFEEETKEEAKVLKDAGFEFKHTPLEDLSGLEEEERERIEEEIKKLEETLGNRAPTCETGGRIIHVCAVCKNVYDVDSDALGHDFQAKVLEEATCTKDGKRALVCTRCDAIKEGSEEIIPATGEHEAVPGSEKSTVTKQPTCTEPGEEVTTAECVHCHQEFKSIKVLPATGHQIGGNVTETVTKEPTCTEEGLKTVTGMGTCTVCGATVDAGSNGATFTIPALGHSFGAWKENADGSKERTCSRCGLKEKVDKDGNLVDPDAPDEPKPPVVDPNKTYSISLGRIYRGTVVRSATTAKAGTAITLTAYANAGYEVSEVYVQDAGGNRVAVSAGEETTYTFTMPASNVTVYASFADAYSSNPPSTGAATPSVRPDASKPSKWNGVPVNQDAPNAAASWTGFYDVPSTHWASGEILWAYQNGYMTANSSGGFNPNGAFTGGQLWVALARLMGQRPANVQEAQQWAMRNGFADGIGPNTKVTRQQLVVALYRCAGLLGRPTNTHGSLSGYIDSATVPVAARNAMSWALMHGIIGGTADKRLNPKGTTTRAQFAVFLYRFSQQIL